MPQWHLTHGETYLVTGEPVIVADLTSSISHSIELLLIAVLLVMAGDARPDLHGAPAAVAAGARAARGRAHVRRAVRGGRVADDGLDRRAAGAGRPCGRLRDPVPGARRARSSRRCGAPRGGARARPRRPTIATAGAASAAAMLVLLLSPVPMVRGFGVLLVVGVAIALLCALTAGAAAISLSSGRAPGSRAPTRSLGAHLAAAWRGARELLADNPLTRLITRAALVGSVRHPGRVLCVGLALAALGWGLDTQTRVQTDITKLVPQNLSSLQNLNTLERITGVGGEIDLMVEGRDLAKPSTIEWMIGYQKAVLARFGYSSARGCGRHACAPPSRCPTCSRGSPRGSSGSAKLSQAEVNGLLSVIPPYFSQDVITPDRRVATLAFGIRLMGLDQQQRLIEEMRSSLHPPAGVSASLVGLPVLAAQSGSQVADPWRRLETLLVGLAAVALVLLAAFRGDRRRALVPLVPIVLATGWSALILFAVRVPLNPMSVTLGALVIAISTEFSVLLSERHRQERLAGYDTIEALRRSYRRTGAAVAASGVTAIAGFGVLVLSDITMLRDFGLVTLIDLSVSLVGVLVALPAALVIADTAAEGGSRQQPVLADLGSVGPSRTSGVGQAMSPKRVWTLHRPGRAADRGAGRDQHRCSPNPMARPASRPARCSRRSRCRSRWAACRATRTSPPAPIRARTGGCRRARSAERGS